MFHFVKKILYRRERFARFLLVGLINTIFGYGVFSLFIFMDFHYTVAAFISTVAGILFNFKTTGNYVFNSNDNNLFVYFVLCYAFIYVINIVGLKVLDSLGVNMYIAGASLLLPMALLAYILNKRFVFKNV